MTSRGPFRSRTALATAGILFIASELLVPASALAAEEKHEPHVVFMISEPEYETEITLPAFAERYLAPRGLRCSMVLGDAAQPDVFSEIAALKTADLLVLSVRRRALPAEQLGMVREYLEAGKPLVGIRTACPRFPHARTTCRRAGGVAGVRSPGARRQLPRAPRDWTGNGRADRRRRTAASDCRRSAAGRLHQ